MSGTLDGKPLKPLLNVRVDWFNGIWYMNQPVNTEYRFKYSGGLGTYCEEHSPFAIHSPLARKTFFCFGGAPPDFHTMPGLTAGRDSERVPDALLHMVACYDHATGLVSRPTLILDKETVDAHDNPVISLDDRGFIWVFSTSHGRSRPSFISRSVMPHDVTAFEMVRATRREEDRDVPFDNFSYMQVRHLPGIGFVAFFTRYGAPAERTPGFITSVDGVTWSRWQPLAAIEKGHYAVSEVTPQRAGMAFNYHPDPLGLNYRTNLYYIETTDLGETWHAADGTTVRVPLTEKHNPCLVHDYEAEGWKVYMKDLVFDDGYPVILYILSRGFMPGPDSGPRIWMTARWTGAAWQTRPICESDSNYDTGCLLIDADGGWRLIAPTDPGPRPYNPGGEMVMWQSADRGASWRKVKRLTSGSIYNHTYARRVENGHDDFVALWADGHGRQPSPSRLYICSRDGSVRMLPPRMREEWEQPVGVTVTGG